MKLESEGQEGIGQATWGGMFPDEGMAYAEVWRSRRRW